MLPRAASAERTVALALWRWHEHGIAVPTSPSREDRAPT